MPNDHHFAIVIGLKSYPRLGDPPPADLGGPENDADAIAAWLMHPNGGGLPEANIKKIKSSDAQSPPNATPTPTDLNKAFIWLDELASRNRPRRVGTRLYFYVSGHGFSPGRSSGCLLTGDSSDRQYSANISPSAWLDWLRDAAYFNEYVLWMDCCMDRVVLTQPTPPPLDPLGVGGIGKAFIAFAAPRPLKAVEKPVEGDGGAVHGVFTWNLLAALQGAAPNGNRLLNSDSLANWLREAQLAWLDDTDRANPSVAKEPAIIARDSEIVFATNLPPVSFNVKLRIPSATADTQVWLWSGDPPQRNNTPTTISPGGSSVMLKPGLYLAEGNGLRHGFVVTRSHQQIDLVDKGDPVVVSAGQFTVRVDPDDPSADIRLCDTGFAVVMGGTGQITSPALDFGLYLLRRTTGRQITEKVILLDGDWPPPGPASSKAPLPPAPEITSAAPLPGTRATHEYQQDAARATIVDATTGDGAQLMVMARWFSKGGQGGPKQPPWQGVSVVDATGKSVLDLETQGRRGGDGADPVATCLISLKPGAYKLRYPIGSLGTFAQTLIVPAGGWRMEAYILHTDTEITGRPAVSLLMRKIGAPWGGDQDLEFQKAMVAFADERPNVNEQLLSAAANPLERIVGAHLLVLSAHKKLSAPEKDEDGARAIFDRLNGIVTELRNLLGGEHPDVEALSLKCSDVKLRTTAPLREVPMFERSWQLLLDGSQVNPALIPTPLWSQVHAAAESPPYLVWAEDNAVQTEYRKLLAQTIFAERAEPATAPAAPPNTVREMASDTLNNIRSYTINGLGKITESLGVAVGRSAGAPVPRPSPRASATRGSQGIPDSEIARRALKLNLPPAAIDALRLDFARQREEQSDSVAP